MVYSWLKLLEFGAELTLEFKTMDLVISVVCYTPTFVPDCRVVHVIFINFQYCPCIILVNGNNLSFLLLSQHGFNVSILSIAVSHWVMPWLLV